MVVLTSRIGASATGSFDRRGGAGHCCGGRGGDARLQSRPASWIVHPKSRPSVIL